MARKNYTTVKPVKQFDATACWAASLEWWQRAMSRAPVVHQLQLMSDYVRYWNSNENDPDYGTVTEAGLKAILTDSKWSMRCDTMPGSSFTARLLNQKVKKGPAVLGYWEPDVGGNHVIVAYGASETHIAAMNPDGGLFQGRPVTRYTNSSRIVIAWPK